MEAFAKTDIGKARDMNQDYYYISPEQSLINLYILADGMGGYTGGEIASKLATISAKNYIESNFEETLTEKEEIVKLIKDSMEYANMVVYEKSKEDKELEGMGTTLEVCLIYNNIVYIGHIGDSRIYIQREEKLKKLTIDHSYVEKLVKDGTITKEEAINHPKKNMLTKALGCMAFVEVDVTEVDLHKDDIILICSDGLTNMVEEETINNVIKEDYKSAPEKLIELANNNGGYDNITALVIRQ